MSDMICFPHLHLMLPHVVRSFSVFGVRITCYGIIIAAAMMAGIFLAVRLAGRTGQNPDMYFNFALIAIVMSVIGARAYYVAFSWDYYRVYPAEIINLRAGGLAIYGGVIAGVLTGLIYAPVRHIRPFVLLDTAVPALVLGQGIGRWGNFFNREAFGGYTDFFTAMQLPVSAVNASDITRQLSENTVMVNGVECIQVHPTFLYESVWDLTVALILVLVLLHGKRRFDGEVFFLYLLLYGAGRFWIERLRTDQLLIPGTAIPVSMALSGVLVLIGLVSLVTGRMRKGRSRIRYRRRRS